MINLLTRLMFEDVWMLAGVGVLASLIALMIHRRRLSSQTRLGLISTVGCFVLLLILQSVVVTDREAVEDTIRALAAAVDDGDIAKISEWVDDSFSTRNWNKESFLAQVTQTLQRWHVDEARIHGFQIELTGNEAAVSFRAYCNLRSDEMAQPNVMSQWKVHCVRSAGKWRLDHILSGKMGFTDASAYDILNQLR